MWVNVEIKNHPREPDFDVTEESADATMAHLIARGEPQRWLISSFRMETIDRCRAIADDADVQIRTAWLTSSVPDDVGGLLAEKGHAALHPWVDVLEQRTVDECHAHGLAVNTWTCDDPDRMRELIDWGVDGICTNVPDVLVAVRAGSE
jgi:glycerophosphoryl diester phosphodiesterase